MKLLFSTISVPYQSLKFSHLRFIPKHVIIFNCIHFDQEENISPFKHTYVFFCLFSSPCSGFLCPFFLFSLFSFHLDKVQRENTSIFAPQYTVGHFHSIQFVTNRVPHNTLKKQNNGSAVKGEQLTKVHNGSLALWLWRYKGGKVLNRKQIIHSRVAFKSQNYFFSKRQIQAGGHVRISIFTCMLKWSAK